MKLLLVEDEKLTREGILQSVPWEDIGIEDIREAIDGIDALAVAEEFQPDIVLTDIKMPRMDGVAFTFQIRRKYPNCKVIFMSGYAEKEYLKAAITLKAISYVEKPLDLDELEDALTNAVALVAEERNRSKMASFSKEKLNLIKRDAALHLIRPRTDTDGLRQSLEWIEPPIPDKAFCATCIVKMRPQHPELETFEAAVEECLEENGLQALAAFKDEMHLIVHLFARDRNRLSETALRGVGSRFSSACRKLGTRHAVSIGKVVQGVASVYESYASAVLALQETFYTGPSSVALYSETAMMRRNCKGVYEIQLRQQRFRESLEREQLQEAERIVRRMGTEIRKEPDTYVNHVKEIYYLLILDLDKFAKERGLDIFPNESGASRLWEQISECHYFAEVEEILLSALQRLESLHNESERGAGHLVSRVMTYVHRHYGEEGLSVQEIGEHLQMTASYVIAAFKEATGKTVLQYIMEYRMEKAKEMLKNNRAKIFDIASQVGFKDGEYFAKVFRKYTGMTPSEYRERFRT